MQFLSNHRMAIRYALIFWFSAWVLIFLTFLSILEPALALRNSLGFVLPLVIPVQLLDVVFSHYFITRRYWVFGSCAIGILVLFGTINYILFKFVVRNPEAESNTLLSIILFFLIFRGIHYFRRGMVQQMKLNEALASQMKLELALRETEARQVKAELDLLKAQINPHFLFNTLNNIYSLVVTGHEHAAMSLIRLSSVMRYVLESGKRDLVPLNEEIRFLEDLLALEEIRLEDQCEITFELGQETVDCMVPPLLFVPLVENCFKHGIGPDPRLNQVTITLAVGKEVVICSTVNRVAPKLGKPLDQPAGLGLKNLKKRLEILWPGRATLECQAEGDEFRVTLTIPVAS